MYRKDSIIKEFISNNLIAIIFVGIVVALVGSWFFTEFLPVHNAKAYFKELEKMDGFTKLMDTREYSQTSDSLNVFGALNEGLDTVMDKAMGYKANEFYNSGEEQIKTYDYVDIYNNAGELVGSGQYVAYWVSDTGFGGGDGYHIIWISAPGKGNFDKEYKIDSSKVTLRKRFQ